MLKDQELAQPLLPTSVSTTLQEVAAAMEDISARVRLLMRTPSDIDTDVGTTQTSDLHADTRLPDEPEHVKHDWSIAASGVCDCGEHALVLPNENGVMTCMACFDCQYLAALTDYAKQLRALLARRSGSHEMKGSVAEGVMHVKALGLLAGMWRSGSEIDRWLDDILASTRSSTIARTSSSASAEDEIEPQVAVNEAMANNYSAMDFKYALGISTQSRRRPAPLTTRGMTYRWL